MRVLVDGRCLGSRKVHAKEVAIPGKDPVANMFEPMTLQDRWLEWSFGTRKIHLPSHLTEESVLAGAPLSHPLDGMLRASRWGWREHFGRGGGWLTGMALLGN